MNWLRDFFQERRLRRQLAREVRDEERDIETLQSTVAELRQRNDRLTEQLAAEQSTNKLKQLEIDLLTQINERNMQRIVRETVGLPPRTE